MSDYVTLWTVAYQAPLSMGFSGQEYWSGLPCPLQGDLPDTGMESMSLMSPALTLYQFTTSTTAKMIKSPPPPTKKSICLPLILVICNKSIWHVFFKIYFQITFYIQTYLFWLGGFSYSMVLDRLSRTVCDIVYNQCMNYYVCKAMCT